MKHFIVGTAGHVDHGKSSLIRALTGIETDRLPEEQARGLSIDLGFAHLTLDSGLTVGIVDVPGHERFLKNMLAGVGGYDLGLLVVDAQEGVMPQTREHLEILDLLHTQRGLAVLTKVDLVEEDFLELVEDDLRQYLAHTFLADSPVVRVSSRTGQGLDELRATLAARLAQAPARNRTAPFRMPVDRAFLKAGFGTVVTGSVWSGTIRKGDRVDVLPSGLETRVRGLQVHGGAVDEAQAGQRVAINLAGLEPGSVSRGQVVAPPGLLTPTQRLDVRVELLKYTPRPLKHLSRIRLYTGTAETLGRVVLLDGEAIAPGGSGLAQLVMESPLVAMRGDRFILRDFTASYTAGGGEVLDPVAVRHRRGDEGTLEDLRRRELGGPEQAILSALAGASAGMRSLSGLAADIQASPAQVEQLLEGLLADASVVRVAKNYALAATVQDLEDRFEGLLINLQKQAPWRSGWRKDKLLKILNAATPKLAEEVLLGMVATGRLVEHDRRLSTPEHESVLTAAQTVALDKVLAHLRSQGCSPDELSQLGPGLGIEPNLWRILESYLLERGLLVKVAPGLHLLAETLEGAQQSLRQFAEQHGGFSPAEARDLLGTTRKYLIPILEYLDHIGFCQRSGERRVVRERKA